MRITQESDYALQILTALAVKGRLTDAGTIAAETAVPPRFALKILHKLVQGGLVTSYKGAHGGYRLSVLPAEITLRQVIELIEGPIALTRCLEDTGACALNSDKAACVYHHIFDRISLELASKLEGITVGDVLHQIGHD